MKVIIVCTEEKKEKQFSKAFAAITSQELQLTNDVELWSLKKLQNRNQFLWAKNVENTEKVEKTKMRKIN